MKRMVFFGLMVISSAALFAGGQPETVEPYGDPALQQGAYGGGAGRRASAGYGPGQRSARYGMGSWGMDQESLQLLIDTAEKVTLQGTLEYRGRGVEIQADGRYYTVMMAGRLLRDLDLQEGDTLILEGLIPDWEDAGLEGPSPFPADAEGGIVVPSRVTVNGRDYTFPQTPLLEGEGTFAGRRSPMGFSGFGRGHRGGFGGYCWR